MKKLEIVCDLDGIAADFFGSLFEQYNALTGENVTQADIQSWNMSDHVKNPDLLQHLFRVPGFFRKLKPIGGAVGCLRQLHAEGHEIHIASSSCTDEGFSEKAHWVSEHLPFISRHNVAIMHRKGQLHGDVLIDDGAHNATAFRARNPSALILSIWYPHNDQSKDHDYLAADYSLPEAAWSKILSTIRQRAE